MVGWGESLVPLGDLRRSPERKREQFPGLSASAVGRVMVRFSQIRKTGEELSHRLPFGKFI